MTSERQGRHEKAWSQWRAERLDFRRVQSNSALIHGSGQARGDDVSGAKQKSGVAKIEGLLLVLWCQAVDAIQSDDFRDSHGKLNERAYLEYQCNAIRRCRAMIQASEGE